MKKLTFPLFLLVLSTSLVSVEAAQTGEASSYIRKAHELRLAEDPMWLRLLHYQTNVLFQRRSAIDDPSFFMSSRGAADPQAELDATLESIFSSSDTADDSVVCRYPARRSWLNEQLHFPKELSNPTCERYESWKTKLAPNAVSLIFASYYFNNPASMYGHTFLKLRRAGYEDGKGLLDYTVNYAAEADSRNGILFAVKGLAGGYKGRFSTDPYYIKIQKYNNIESRDLWEYELNFSSAEINRLVQHMWELGPVSITYYFFNKNCSYQLLPLLEVARPSLHLCDPFRFRAIPLDTLQQVLHQEGLVKKWTVRPSHVQIMLTNRAKLNNDEQRLAKLIALDVSTSNLQRMNALPPPRQSAVLDSAYDYLRYKAGFYRDRPLAFQEQEQKLLLLRKNRPAAPAITNSIAENTPPPHLGHPTGQVGLMYGADKKDTFEEVSFRAALHDQEADPIGYIPGSQLEMFHMKGRYQNDAAKFRLENLTLIDVFSLTPRDPWVHPPSWRVWAGADVARDLNVESREVLDAGVKGGSGVSFFLSERKMSLWFMMWRAEGVVGDGFEKGYRAGAGGQSGFLLTLSTKCRIYASADALRFPVGHVGNVVRYYGAFSVSLKKNMEFRLIGERQNGYQEGRGGFILYW